MNSDTYRQPTDGWVCFHCGDRFTTDESAREHFGAKPTDTAACRIKTDEEQGLLTELRRAEAVIRELIDNERRLCGNVSLSQRALADHKWMAHRIR